MTVRKIDPDTGGISTRGVQFVSGSAEIAQTILTRLRLFTGEYVRDITEGTPWMDVVFSKSKSLSSKEAALKSRVLGSPGVVRILTFEMDFEEDERKISVNTSVLTTTGVVTLSEEI